MCGLTREDQANLARVYSSVDMGRFEPLYTDTARVLETHFARLAQRPHREDSACSSIKQQCAPLLTFPLFSVHARALASMRDVIAPLISQRSCSRRICACSSVLALACSAHGVPVRSSPAGDFSPFLLGLRLFSARTDILFPADPVAQRLRHVPREHYTPPIRRREVAMEKVLVAPPNKNPQLRRLYHDRVTPIHRQHDMLTTFERPQPKR